MAILKSAMSTDTVDNTHPIVALQLYTIRDALSQNLHDTLGKVAEMGYRYVEVADTYNYTLPEFVKILETYNLTAISSHIDYLVLLQDAQKAIKEAKEAGVKYIVIPWIGPEVWENDSLRKDTISMMDGIAKDCNKQGIQLCYHNHAHEINNPMGINFLDFIIESTSSIWLELDLGWVYVATGENPLNLVKKYTSRIGLFHLKDVEQIDPVLFTELGEGKSINWAQILPEIWQINKSPWIIEQDDNFRENSISSAGTGFINIQKILTKI